MWICRSLNQTLSSSIYLTNASYLIHSPYFAETEEDLQDAWQAMENVQQSGKAKAIGVSSFLRPHIEAIQKTATIQPVVNQIEFHPYLQRANNYVPWLQEQGFDVQAFFGLVTLAMAKGVPLDRPLAALASKHNVDASAVLIMWALNQNVVSISTSKKEERLQQYFPAIDLELDAEDVDTTTQVGLKRHFRVCLSDKFDPEDRR